MKRYYRMTVSGASQGNAVHEDVIYMEGQDPVVLAFRRNNALCGMNTVSMTAPAEAFCAGTMEKPERTPTARELKRRARQEAYRERMNERLTDQGPRRFHFRFGPENNNG